MIVLDANILIRAVLGRRVRQLVETYAAQGVRFFAPDVAFDDAEKYLPPLLKKRGKPDAEVSAALKYLRHIIETVDRDLYAVFEEEARQRLRGRDEDDWPVMLRRSDWLARSGPRMRTSSELASRCGLPTASRFF
jgi:predicted nucleic acid-binding protein